MMKKMILAAAIAAFSVPAAAAEDPGAQGNSVLQEIAKQIIIERVIENAKSADREGGTIDKVIRVFGPSVRDIKKDGLFGGRSSVFHKPFG